MFFAPGKRYAYSGEGINLLGFMVEQVTGFGVAELMQRRVFDRFGMKWASMIWRDEFAGNLAEGHDEQGKGLGHSKRMSARAAGSMDTAIADFALFLRGVMQGEGISKATKVEMPRTQIRIRSKAQFPTLSRPSVRLRRDPARLRAGLGRVCNSVWLGVLQRGSRRWLGAPLRVFRGEGELYRADDE